LWGLNQATGHLYSRFCVFSLETLYASGQEYPGDSRTAKAALVTQRAGTASVPHGTVQNNSTRIYTCFCFFKYSRTGNGRESNTEARSRNRCYRRDAINIKDYDCVCILASGIQHAKRIVSIRIISSSVRCLSLPYISHYLIHGTFFLKKTEHKMCILICYNFCLKRF
jgi:hypothetical protein